MPDDQAARAAAPRSGAGPASSDPPGTPARRAALRLLDAVLRRGEALDGAHAGATRGLPPADAALALVIAGEALRRLPDLDALIDGATRQRLPDDAKARMALRIALVQALVLGTPPHAAIATVLPLVDGGPRKLVHGVFGTLSRGGAALPPQPALPAAVAARWAATWGEATVTAASEAIAAAPPLDLSLAAGEDAGEWARRLDGQSLAPAHVRVARGRPVTALPGYAEGRWWVQDLAATIPARLVPPGGVVVDACAAPGGKTLQLADGKRRVFALDLSARRLERLAENVGRVGAEVTTICADARAWQPPELVDAVLLDAPCSATGIFRRHPDVLHRVAATTIADMAAIQRELLAAVARWLRPGGTLVYATCSLEPEEGEAQMAPFLTAHPEFRLAPVQPGELPPGIAPAPAGWVRTLPGTLAAAGGCDGFFVARLVRASA